MTPDRHRHITMSKNVRNFGEMFTYPRKGWAAIKLAWDCSQHTKHITLQTSSPPDTSSCWSEILVLTSVINQLSLSLYNIPTTTFSGREPGKQISVNGDPTSDSGVLLTVPRKKCLISYHVYSFSDQDLITVTAMSLYCRMWYATSSTNYQSLSPLSMVCLLSLMDDVCDSVWNPITDNESVKHCFISRKLTSPDL